MLLEELVIPISLDSGILLEGLNLVKKGLSGVADFLKDSTQEAMKSQDVQSQLGAVLKSTGGAAGVSADMANELASKYQKLTKFSDESVLSGENMLLTFTSIGKDVFPRATETILNMSTALGQDLNSSAIQLGKALNDPIAGVTALKRVGVQFTDSQKDMIKSLVESGNLMGAQTVILDELQKEFGGSAVAAGQTFGGQLEIVKNKISDIKERIGGALLPVLQDLAQRFSTLIDSPLFQQLVADVTNALAGLGSWISENLPKWIDQFTKFIDTANAKYDELKAKFDQVLTLMIDDTAYNNALKLDSASTSTELASMGRAFYAFSSDAMKNLHDLSTEWSRLKKNVDDILTALGLKAQDTGSKWGILNTVIGYFATPLLIANKVVKDAVSVLQSLNNILESVKSKLDKLSSAARNFANQLASISLPWWLTPGSPTPLENGLRGVNSALAELNNKSLLSFSASINNLSSQQAPAFSFDYARMAKENAVEFAKAFG